MAQIMTQGFRFGIQFLLFLVVWTAWMVLEKRFSPSPLLFVFPFFLLQLVVLASGLGLWLSVAVSRYRDVEPITVFLLRLAMFATPVLYPLVNVPDQWSHWFMVNPLTLVFEGTREGFFGEGSFAWQMWLLSWLPTVLLFYLGLKKFQQEQIQIMDTL